MNINHQEFEDRIAQYLSGNLTEAEEIRLEQDALSNPELQQIFSKSLLVLQQLSLQSVTNELPSAGLKDKILSAVRAEASPSKEPSIFDKNPELLRAAEGWMESPMQGITMKVLHMDAGRARYTLLLRMTAGFHYPNHRHHGEEQCLVIEGDLTVDGNRLTAGDYIYSDDNTPAHHAYTENGCLLMLNTEMADEFI